MWLTPPHQAPARGTASQLHFREKEAEMGTGPGPQPRSGLQLWMVGDGAAEAQAIGAFSSSVLFLQKLTKGAALG